MKTFKILIMAVAILIAAAISVGCTENEKQTTPTRENTPKVTEITAQATVVPEETTEQSTGGELKPGDQVSSATVTNNNFTCYEYRENTTSQTPEGNIVQFVTINRNEYSKSEYNGEPAILLKITHNSVNRGWSSVSEYYYDETRTRRLYGIIVTNRENEAPIIEELAAEDIDSGNYGFFGKNVTLTYLGTESVTVTAGTFPDAGKYSYHYPKGNFDVTYWFSPGIPVPVLSRLKPTVFAGCEGLESNELIAWG